MNCKVLLLIFLIAFSSPLWAHYSTEVDRGLNFLSEGRLEEAEAALQRARFDNPADPRISYNLGIISFRKRNYAGAATEWARALGNTEEPNFKSDVLHNIGNAAYRIGNFAKAVDSYKSSLEIREDPMTRHNLEQAQKKLQEEMDRQKKQENQQQKDQNKSGDQNDNQQNSDQKDNQGKSGDQNKDGKQKSREQEQKSGDQNKSSDQKQGDQDKQGNQEKKDQEGKPTGNTASDTRQQIDPKTASDTAMQEKQEQERQDLKMAEEKKDQVQPNEASQRARGLKNQQLNPYRVEQILRQMEEREKEVQLRYRNDPRREDEMDRMMDPFFMDADEIRQYLEQRQGKRTKKPPSNKPDW